MRENHVVNFKTAKELKMNVFDFLTFPRKMQMPSQEKILIHMLFEALCGTTPYGLQMQHYVRRPVQFRGLG